MSIPGVNLLNMALTIISKQAITYHQAIGRALNNIGQDVTTYELPAIIYGSFQPVPKNLYEQFGLDLQKSYYTFYTSNNLIDVQRNVSNDQISFNNQRFQCESNNDWFMIDGWKGILCSLITATNEDNLIPIFGFNTYQESNTNENFTNGGFP